MPTKTFLYSSSRLRQQSDEYYMQSVPHELLLGDGRTDARTHRRTDGRTDGRRFLNELRLRALAPGGAQIGFSCRSHFHKPIRQRLKMFIRDIIDQNNLLLGLGFRLGGRFGWFWMLPRLLLLWGYSLPEDETL